MAWTNSFSPGTHQINIRDCFDHKSLDCIKTNLARSVKITNYHARYKRIKTHGDRSVGIKPHRALSVPITTHL